MLLLFYVSHQEKKNHNLAISVFLISVYRVLFGTLSVAVPTTEHLLPNLHQDQHVSSGRIMCNAFYVL